MEAAVTAAWTSMSSMELPTPKLSLTSSDPLLVFQWLLE
jgi:hypothetical protein